MNTSRFLQAASVAAAVMVVTVVLGQDDYLIYDSELNTIARAETAKAQRQNWTVGFIEWKPNQACWSDGLIACMLRKNAFADYAKNPSSPGAERAALFSVTDVAMKAYQVFELGSTFVNGVGIGSFTLSEELEKTKGGDFSI